MNDVTRPPPPQDPEDVDDRYRRASAADPSRPSATVRQAILANAAKVAAGRKSGRNVFFSWLRGLSQGWSGPALVGTLAAAAIAGMVIVPRVQMFHRARVEMEAPKRGEELQTEEITVTAQRRESQNDMQSASPITTVEEPKSLAAVAPPSESEGAQTRSEQHLPDAIPAPSLDIAPAPALPESPPQPQPSAFPDTARKAQPAPVEQFEARESAPAAKQVTGGLAQDAAAARAEVAPKAAGATARNAAPPPAQPSASSPAANERRVSGLELQEVTVTGTSINEGPPYKQMRLNYELRRAAEKGNLSTLDSLMSRGAYIDTPDSLGRTPLLLAVQKRHADIVKALLAGGANPNIGDNKGMTPLKAALDSGQNDLAEVLRNRGAH